MWTKQAVIDYFGVLLDDADKILERHASAINTHYTDEYKTKQIVNSQQVELATFLLKNLVVSQVQLGRYL